MVCKRGKRELWEFISGDRQENSSCHFPSVISRCCCVCVYASTRFCVCVCETRRVLLAGRSLAFNVSVHTEPLHSATSEGILVGRELQAESLSSTQQVPDTHIYTDADSRGLITAMEAQCRAKRVSDQTRGWCWYLLFTFPSSCLYFFLLLLGSVHPDWNTVCCSSLTLFSPHHNYFI